MKMNDLAFVGTRTTEKRNARGRGIEVFDATQEPWVHIETVPVINPSFLALDRRNSVLHAVHGDMSELSSYAVKEAAGGAADPIMAPLGQRSTGGTNPAHIVIDPDGEWLIVTNHSSGTVASFRILEDGTPTDVVDVLAFAGEPGPFSDDQTGAKPHQAVFLEPAESVGSPETSGGAPDGEPGHSHFLVPDKGLDTVFRCSIDRATGRMEVIDELRLRQGCGPRHLVIHPHADRTYVLGELGNTVTVVIGAKSREPGAMKAVQIVSTLPDHDVRDSRGGEIVLGSDGAALWATNRSGAGDSTPGGPDEDTAAVWDIDEDGRLALRTHVGTGGVRPRFATTHPLYSGLDVALERSHRIVRIETSGSESDQPEPALLAEILSPVCIVYGAEPASHSATAGED